MSLTLTLNEAEEARITDYVRRKKTTVTDFFRETIFREINKEEEERAQRNADYLAMIDRGLKQIAEGRCQQHELIEVDDE